jgi:hypothetical protein
MMTTEMVAEDIGLEPPYVEWRWNPDVYQRTVWPFAGFYAVVRHSALTVTGIAVMNLDSDSKQPP